jgi:hypothetical protein
MAKQPTPEDASLFFNDGCAVRDDTVLLAGQFNAFPDADASRLAMLVDDEWVHRDVRGDTIRSVAFHPGTQQCHFMGRNGLIVTGGGGARFSRATIAGTFRELSIRDVEHYGELFRIRFISDSVYCCGQSSQIYRLKGGSWSHFDQGLLDTSAETLEDIGGSGPDDLYAVGMSGTIAHFDGNAWRLVDSPTNQHLSNVCCVDKDEVYICGNGGTVFRGRVDNWTSIGDPDAEEEIYWGLAVYRDEVYVAHDGGIKRFDGTAFVPVPIGLPVKRKPTFHRLQAVGDILYSFGVDDIFCFDGAKWTELLWPDNK